ncbi:MAG: Ig-like domain-containing protein [Burkholderiaceae bacterium]
MRFDDDGHSSEVGAAMRVAVVDPDGPNPGGDYSLTVHGFHGVINVDTTGTGTVLYDGGSLVVVRGTLDELNHALSGLVFTTDEHYLGNTVVRMTVTEPSGAGEAIELVVHVLNQNSAPQAADDLVELGTARGPISGSVIFGDAQGMGADSDPDGDPIGVVGLVAGQAATVPVGGLRTVISGQYGDLEMDCYGEFRYMPGAAADALAPGQVVRDHFSYLLADPEGGRDVAVLSFELRGAQPTDPAPAPPPAPEPPAPAPVPEPPTNPVPPPIVVGPPVPEPLLPPPAPGTTDPGPLPPDTGEPASPGPTALPPAAAFALSEPVLMASRTDLGGAGETSPFDARVLADSLFSPFAPSAVLGRIESERALKQAEVERAAIQAVKADADCAPPKPKVVKRSALVDGEVVKVRPKTFTKQVESEDKRLKPPVKRHQVRGMDC